MVSEAFWIIYICVAAVAGAITALYFRPWQDMTWPQIGFAVFVGTTFAIFVAPLLFRNIADQQVAGGIFYLMATASNAMIPLFIKWLASLVPGNGTSKDGPK